MSNLTPGQHKQLLNAILEYLQELELRAPAGLIHDQLQLTSAIQHLAAATGLIAPNAAPYAIHPHTLPSVFSAAGIPAPVRPLFALPCI